MPDTKFLTDGEVDEPLVQDANYRFNPADRQYIDKQVRAVQQYLVDESIVLPDGLTAGDMLFYNGTSFERVAGAEFDDAVLTWVNGAPAWVGGAPVFDPATLNLTWYFDSVEGAYNGTTWTSLASAGPSGARTLVAGSAPPATGGAPDFNGSTQWLAPGSALKFDSLLTGSAYFIQCVFVADTFQAYGGSPPNDEMIVADEDGNLYIGISTSGLQFGHYDGTAFKSTKDAGGAGAGFIAISAGTKYCVQAWYDGTNLNCRVNNGAVMQVAAANVSNLDLLTPSIGKNYNDAAWFDGRMSQLITMASVPNSTTRDDLLAAAQAVHGF